MSLSMYQASVPVFQRTLAALDKFLDKAAVSAEERKIDPAARSRSRPTTPKAPPRGLRA
jgi:hypothetical protein